MTGGSRAVFSRPFAGANIQYIRILLLRTNEVLASEVWLSSNSSAFLFPVTEHTSAILDQPKNKNSSCSVSSSFFLHSFRPVSFWVRIPSSLHRRISSVKVMKRRVSSRTSAAVAADKKKKSKPPSIVDKIVSGLREKSDSKTKAWFTNYVKGSEWIGCKSPVVRSVVVSVAKEQNVGDDPSLIIESGIALLQHSASDVKLSGIILLQEVLPRNQLASHAMLDRFDRDIWSSESNIANWSTSDWFAVRVLKNIVFSTNAQGELDESLIRRVLGYAKLKESTLWQRRCGVIPFLDYHKYRVLLPTRFGSDLIAACEESLLISPHERFTQTGIAWLLRHVLLQKEERKEAVAMICRHGSLWTTEAKKSLTEKLTKSDPVRKKIFNLGSK